MPSKVTHLKLCTWNVRAVISSAVSISNILDHTQCDILAITEPKLFDHSLKFLNSIHADYDSYGRADQSVNQYCGLRCGKGGVGFMFRKYLRQNIEVIENCGNERILGVKVGGYNVLNKPLYIFVVYMPADSVIEMYDSYLEELSCMYNTYSEMGHVILCGDFNGRKKKYNFQTISSLA